MISRLSDRLTALLVFGVVFLLLFLLHGNRLMLGTNDEGIVLEAGRRMLAGQTIYVDFFVMGAPFFYWVQEWTFRLLGFSMAAGRIPVLIYFAIESAMLFWITARLSSRRAAAVATAFFVAFQTADPAVLTPQHRWDSGAVVLLAIGALLHAQGVGSRLWTAISGVLFVLAAFFTPSIALVGIVTFLWLAVRRVTWWLLPPFLAGCAVMTVAMTGILWGKGVLFPFFEHLQWLSRNYTGANTMPYGSIIGGYGSLLSGGFSLEWAIRAAIVLGIALPAILPIVSVAGWTGALWFQRTNPTLRHNAPSVIYLLLCMGALIAAIYPRADVPHLAFVATVPSALAAAWIFWYLPRAAWLTVFISLTCIGSMFCLNTASTLLAEKRIHTPIGVVRTKTETARQVEALLKAVHPGDSLFVHSYKPLLYFLTQARNPSRFSFLQPGMMTEDDARIALQELRRDPPQWVLHLDLSREEFLRVFPSSDPSRVEFKSVEEWIHSGYSEATEPGIIVDGYKLFKRNPATSASR